MRALTSAADAITLRLNVLQLSDARRMYERHGFTLDREDQVDVYLHRLPTASWGPNATTRRCRFWWRSPAQNRPSPPLEKRPLCGR